MRIHLVDGTYELFRCFFGAPSAVNAKGQEVGATRALLRSTAAWLRTGEVTHVAFAFDHVIESFRNDLFAGYKTGEGIAPGLYSQFGLAERAIAALGIVVWPMVEFEADDALASGARRLIKVKSVTQVVLCSPDKDLAQCVDGDRIVCLDRLRQTVLNAAGVAAKFGVPPAAIPDLLALVGDTADGIPGIPRWGMKTTASVLAVYPDLEQIPADAKDWAVTIRGAKTLADNLAVRKDDARLYRQLATLRFDVPLQERVQDLEWRGADRELLSDICREIDDGKVLERVTRWR